MRENLLGRLVRECWIKIPLYFAVAETDVFVVMPNHVHGVIHLHRPVPPEEEQFKLAKFGKPNSGALGTVVQVFKAAVTREARRVLRRPELVVWQKNYYERVVRDSAEYADVCRYIAGNPRSWDYDEENLDSRKP